MAQLLRAAGNGNLEKVMAMRSDWNHQNKKGESALHVAVAEDQLEVVAYLVSNGVMMNQQLKKNKFTPLMLCLAQQPPRFEELFQALLKGKPDLGVLDSSGQTVLHLATQYEEIEALEMLLKAKAKVEAVDGKKMTALHVAAGKGSLELVQLLVEKGHANVNAVDSKGNTPLHWACIKNDNDLIELIEYLVSKGAKPLKNSFGNTPLHSEAMHCDANGAWPTAAAEALSTAFPDLLTEVNKNGLTAQQTFDQDIDGEEPAEENVAANASKKSKRGDKSSTTEEIRGNIDAARAAAIAHSRKKAAKGNQEGGGMGAYVWIAILFAVLALLFSIFGPSE